MSAKSFELLTLPDCVMATFSDRGELAARTAWEEMSLRCTQNISVHHSTDLTLDNTWLYLVHLHDFPVLANN